MFVMPLRCKKCHFLLDFLLILAFGGLHSSAIYDIIWREILCRGGALYYGAADLMVFSGVF